MYNTLVKRLYLLILCCSYLLLDAQPQLFQQEKVYLHTDRVKYGAGETVYFSAYHYDPVELSAEGSSEVLYVELINNAGELIADQRIKLVDGRASGSIDIDYQLSNQHITLRAYTNYMRNFDDADFFRKSLEVVGSEQAVGSEDQNEDVLLQAFPEGGVLLSDVVSVVGIKLQRGNSGIEGEIELFQDGESVDLYETNKFGFGKIVFTPKQGSVYTIQYDDQDYTLPEPKSQGVNIRTRTTEDLFIISIDEKGVSDIAEYTALIISANQVIYNEILAGPILKLEKEYLPTGLITLAILTPDNRPVCERLLFNHYDIDSEFLDIGAPSPEPGTRTLIEIPIDVYDIEGDPIQASFSAAVVDNRYYATAQGIRTEWLLSSEIKGYIEDPDQYLVENSEEVIDKTDLLLLTQGWRTYDWDKTVTLDYAKEQGLPINGRVVKPKKVNDGLKTYGTVSILDENFDILPLESDEEGYFSISDLGRTGELPLFFQMGTKKPKEDSEIGGSAKGNTDIEILLDQPDIHPITEGDIMSQLGYQNSATQKPSYQVDAIPDDEFIVNEGLLIDEVTIKAKKLDQWVEYYDDDIDYSLSGANRIFTDNIAAIGGYDDIYDILRGRATGIEITFSVSGESRHDVVIRGFSTGLIEGTEGNNAAKFLLNGSAVSASTIEAINPIDIAFVDVIKGLSALTQYGEYGSAGIVAVYLKPPGARSNSRAPSKKKKNTGVYADYQAYSQAKAFYKVNYGAAGSYEKESIRRTVHWEPMIRTDDEGTASISFYTSDYIGTYHIDVQGVTDTGQPLSQTVRFTIK